MAAPYPKALKNYLRELFCKTHNLEATLEEAREVCPGVTKYLVKTWVDSDFIMKEKQRNNNRNKVFRGAHPDLHQQQLRSKREAYKQKYKNNPVAQQERREKYRAYVEENREVLSVCARNYFERHREKINEYWSKRRKRDHVYRLVRNLRYIVNYQTKNSLKKRGDNYNKMYHTLEILGCTGEVLADHLRSLYTEGMTDENYGEWHVDHIRPCASFDMTDPEQASECFHYTNLQPLWAKDNRQKSDKYVQ